MPEIKITCRSKLAFEKFPKACRTAKIICHHLGINKKGLNRCQADLINYLYWKKSSYMTLNFYAEKTISDKQQKRPKRTGKVEPSDRKQFVGPTKICPAMESW